jgi:hypothetical protein
MARIFMALTDRRLIFVWLADGNSSAVGSL